MPDFNPEKLETNVDFIAWSVARMEFDKRPISASAVAGNMCHIMAGQFYKRLHYFRPLFQKRQQSSQGDLLSVD